MQHVLDPPVLPLGRESSDRIDRPGGDHPARCLERYRADVFLLDRSPSRKSGLLTDLKVFLDDVRLHDWARRAASERDLLSR